MDTSIAQNSTFKLLSNICVLALGFVRRLRPFPLHSFPSDNNAFSTWFVRLTCTAQIPLYLTLHFPTEMDGMFEVRGKLFTNWYQFLKHHFTQVINNGKWNNQNNCECTWWNVLNEMLEKTFNTMLYLICSICMYQNQSANELILLIALGNASFGMLRECRKLVHQSS